MLEFFFFPVPNSFFTYSDRSAVSLSTLSGDVDLSADTASIVFEGGDYVQRSQGPADEALLRTYPGSLSARSFDGDVRINHTIEMFPSPGGALELLAGDSITAAGSTHLRLSDGDLNVLPSLQNPRVGASIEPSELSDWLRGHAPTPVHLFDDAPALVAARDRIDGLSLISAKQARVFAGEDVANLTLFVQHSRADDVTVVEAARDIAYPIERNPSGGFSANNGIISVEGPGRIDLIAGRDVDFGVAQGVGLSETSATRRWPTAAPTSASGPDTRHGPTTPASSIAILRNRAITARSCANTSRASHATRRCRMSTTSARLPKQTNATCPAGLFRGDQGRRPRRLQGGVRRNRHAVSV